MLGACSGQAREAKPVPAVTPPVAPSAAPGVSAPAAAVSAPLAVEPAPVPAELEVRRSMLDDELDYRKTPAQVEAELKHTAEAYASFQALRRLPDFLSLDQLLAMMPEQYERDTLRDQIHAQLEGGEGQALLGARLDDSDERLQALWLAGNLTQVLAIYDGGRLTAKRVVSRGKPMLGDVLAERDGSRLEILIESITSMSVCCHPMSLDVLRVSKRGVLTQALSFPRGHAEVGPGVRWSFLNHFEFEGQRVVISSAFPGGLPSYELVYDPRAGKYQPTPATVKLLTAERREREKLKASGQLLEE